MSRRGVSWLWILLGGCVVVASLRADAALAADPPAEVAFFNKEVLPILESRCYSCHSHAAGKSKGGLVVDSKAGLATGGYSGAAVIPGDPANSLLMDVVRRIEPETAMPPDNPLSAAEVKTLETWIRRGAIDPRVATKALDPFAEIMRKATTHWSLQPIVKPRVPGAKAAERKMAEVGATPAATIAKSTPPGKPVAAGKKAGDGKPSASTPAAVAAPAAKRALVGERHPIDAFIQSKLRAHELKPAAEAAPRDLIRRLSFDLVGLPPTYERVSQFERDFRTEPNQAVAALVDELLASPHYGERWGRHWLDLARFAEVSGGPENRARETRLLHAFTYRDYVIRSLNQDKPFNRFVLEQLAADQLDLEDQRDIAALGFLPVGSQEGTQQEVRAERIDTVGKVFLGLSIGCARCHDHKFDPISTADFYALDGVFLSTQEIGVPRPRDPVGDFDACPIIAEPKSPALLAERKAAIKKAEAKIAAYEEELWGPTEIEWRKLSPTVWRVLAMPDSAFGALGEREYLLKQNIPRVLVDAWRTWIRDQERLSRRTTHPILDPWLQLSKLDSKSFAADAAKILAAYTPKSGVNRHVLAELRTAKPKSLAEVAAVYGQLFLAIDKEWQANPRRTALADADREALRQVLYGAGGPPVRDPSKWRNHFGNAADTKRNQMLADLNDAVFQHAGAPQRAMVLGDRGPQDARILIRGEADQPGDRVPRGFLTVLGRDGKRQEFSAKASGRLELAQAIVDPQNPLAARVLVNRVWAQHFGKPLAASVDDFGLQTPVPEHRALLDWLAATFIEEGWSLKKLHRLMLTTRTYRQSSTDHTDYVRQATLDPDNALFWRASVRRLDFETQRDAVLATCGTLDRTLYGRSVDVISDLKTARRTVYAWIDRPLQPLLATFDVPDNSLTSGDRHESTSPGQALFLMNSGFLDQHAAALVSIAEFRAISDSRARIAWLYRQLLQRAPLPNETEVLVRFWQDAGGKDRHWRDVVVALMLTNEFAHSM